MGECFGFRNATVTFSQVESHAYTGGGKGFEPKVSENACSADIPRIGNDECAWSFMQFPEHYALVFHGQSS